jgi:protein associated with RNAse G/E
MMIMEKNQQIKLIQVRSIQQNQDQMFHMVDMLIIMKSTEKELIQLSQEQKEKFLKEDMPIILKIMVKKKYQKNIRKSIIRLKNNHKY